MTILGIGVDVVHIPRIVALLNRRGSQRFVNRILSQEELSHWESLPPNDITSNVQFLAVRWGIKEAAYKAMYPIVRPTWKELTYRALKHVPVGSKPQLIYQPHTVSQVSKIGPIHLSVSHDKDYVFTSVILEGPS